MRKLLMICALLLAVSASAQGVSEKYRAIWGDSVQMSIDREIERNRKADAVSLALKRFSLFNWNVGLSPKPIWGHCPQTPSSLRAGFKKFFLNPLSIP